MYHCVEKIKGKLISILSIKRCLLIIVFVFSNATLADDKIPFEVTGNCSDDIGSRTVETIRGAVEKGWTLYNDVSKKKFLMRPARSSEESIIIDFSCRRADSFIFNNSLIDVSWYFNDNSNNKKLLAKKTYKQGSGDFNLKMTGNDIIYDTCSILTSQNLLPKTD